MTEKEAVTSLLKNCGLNLKEVCRKAEISYTQVTKQLTRGRFLHSYACVEGIANTLGLPSQEFSNLLRQAVDGNIAPEDLQIPSHTLHERDRIVEFLTPAEHLFILELRAQVAKERKKAAATTS